MKEMGSMLLNGYELLFGSDENLELDRGHGYTTL